MLSSHWKFRIAALAGLAFALLPAGARSATLQGQSQQPPPQQQGQQPPPSLQPKPNAPSPLGSDVNPPAPKVDPEEDAAFKNVSGADLHSPENIIKLANDFFTKFPDSRYKPAVYARLTQAYWIKQNTELDPQAVREDNEKMLAAGEKTIELNPNDVDILALIGWVLPHSYSPKDLDADQKLARAEAYTKRGIVLLASIQKPAGITDEDFDKSKKNELSMCHSGLGLVYFRQQKYADSATELAQATQLASSFDPVDFYILGLDYVSLNRATDAVTAFGKCAGTQSQLQGVCQSELDQAKKLASQAPPKP